MVSKWEYKFIPGLGVRKVRLITPEEHNASFDKNLCLLCSNSWSPGHDCSLKHRMQLIYLDVEEDLVRNETGNGHEVEDLVDQSRKIENSSDPEENTLYYREDLQENSRGNGELDNSEKISENGDGIDLQEEKVIHDNKDDQSHEFEMKLQENTTPNSANSSIDFSASIMISQMGRMRLVNSEKINELKLISNEERNEAIGNDVEDQVLGTKDTEEEVVVNQENQELEVHNKVQIKASERSEDFKGTELEKEETKLLNMFAEKQNFPINACNIIFQIFKYDVSNLSVTCSFLNIFSAQPSHVGTLLLPLQSNTIMHTKPTFNLTKPKQMSSYQHDNDPCILWKESNNPFNIFLELLLQILRKHVYFDKEIAQLVNEKQGDWCTVIEKSSEIPTSSTEMQVGTSFQAKVQSQGYHTMIPCENDDYFSVMEVSLEEFFESDSISYRMDQNFQAAFKLRYIIDEKFCDSFWNYFDEDALAEYMLVLVCNGKNQNQARDDLEACLGDKSANLIAWLCNYLVKENYISRAPLDSSLNMEVSRGHEVGSNKEWISSILKDHYIQSIGILDISLPTNGRCNGLIFMIKSTCSTLRVLIGNEDGCNKDGDNVLLQRQYDFGTTTFPLKIGRSFLVFPWEDVCQIFGEFDNEVKYVTLNKQVQNIPRYPVKNDHDGYAKELRLEDMLPYEDDHWKLEDERQEVYKILGNIFVFWVWRYKDFEKARVMTHPGSWNMEWLIAWI